MWSGVARPASATQLYVFPVGHRSLQVVDVENDVLLAGQAAAKGREQELALRGGDGRLCGYGAASRDALRQVLVGTPNQLERRVERLLVGLAPGHQAVVLQHERMSVRGLLDREEREGESGANIRNEPNLIAEGGGHGGAGVRLIRQRADRVGVDVVDVDRRQEGV